MKEKSEEAIFLAEISKYSSNTEKLKKVIDAALSGASKAIEREIEEEKRRFYILENALYSVDVVTSNEVNTGRVKRGFEFIKEALNYVHESAFPSSVVDLVKNPLRKEGDPQ